MFLFPKNQQALMVLEMLFLKEQQNLYNKPLTRLFNYSLHRGIFPSTWKLAHVCPIFKKETIHCA